MSQIIKLKNSSSTSAPTSLEYGEVALGYLKGSEKLYFKNSNGEIITLNDWSKLLSKPTTLSGFGITDAVGSSTFNTHVASNLHLTDSQRSVLSLLSVVDGKLKIDADTYSTGELSAYGVGTGGGGGAGLIQSVYGSSGLGGTYLDSDLTNSFNAYTVNLINSNLNSAISRISTLEGGSATSISTTGTGNAITSVTKSGTALTFTKGTTFIAEGDSRLTDARKNPNALTFTGYSTATYDGSAAISVPIPTKVSQLTNDSSFLTAITKAQVEAVLTGNITSHTHSQYLTGNQTISVTGDATGSGTTAIALTLANSGVTAGTYRSVTVDAKGRVTAGTNPTTLSGYGITDALSSSGGTISGNLTVTGNLVLNGTTTTVNSTTITIDDPILTLGGDTAPTVNDGKDRGIEFRYYDTAAKFGFFGYDASTGYFSMYTGATNTSEVFSGTLGDIAATNFRGALVGNASTATALSSSRTFALTGDVTGSITSDLSGGFSIATTIAANSVALGTDTTGNYAASIAVSGTGLSLTGAAGEGTAYTITSNATNANTASTIVARDASGNFSAGTISAALSGNASTASKLATARTLTVSGTGISSTGGTFDGSGNIAIAMSIDVIDGGTW